MLIDKIKYFFKTDKTTRAYDFAQYRQIKRACAEKQRDVTNAMCEVMHTKNCFWIEPDESDRNIGFLVPQQCYTKFCPQFNDTKPCVCTACHAYKLNKKFFDVRDEYVALSDSKYSFWKNANRRTPEQRAARADEAQRVYVKRERELSEKCAIAAEKQRAAQDAICTPLFVQSDTPRRERENCLQDVHYDSMSYCADYDHGLDINVVESCKHFNPDSVCSQEKCPHYIDNKNMIQATKEFKDAQREYRKFTGKVWEKSK